jgi:shikimate dehydrogenase
METVDKYGRVLWVAGSPIDHTLSPAIHNAAFEAADLPHRYFALEVGEDEVRSLLDLFRQIGALGVNLTLPLKERVCELVDHRTDNVERLGAANTIFRENGELKLDNTDVYGFTRLLDPWHDLIGESPVLLLGAGGAARACLLALDRLGCPEIFLWNRTTERARSLREEFADMPIECVSDDWLAEGSHDARVAINATSLGLDEGDPSPLPESAVHDRLIGVDLIYNRRTAFIEDIDSKGQEAVGGLKMLVHQAARAWEHWVGDKPDVDTMTAAAEKELESS